MRGLTDQEAGRELAEGRAVVTLTYREYFALRMKANRCERLEAGIRELLAQVPNEEPCGSR